MVDDHHQWLFDDCLHVVVVVDRYGSHSEKAEKDVGLGVIAPLYVSGPQAVGWWAMFITMLGDMTAYLSLVFAYFFYWTIHTDFPPPHAQTARTPIALGFWRPLVVSR